ncbi:unnamed protein product [Cylicocyclus nassatus]|uniref:Uncharacterized protein n=1 Tax=Cylicocyclus nassatus TaxID=53992 RepID=A0AA36DUS3_CYLNA|nr:unnamed protein product [Cylicocyclus nassatus]
MDGDEDVQVVFENCNNQTWKTARDNIRSNYRTVGQSSGFKCYSSGKTGNEKSEEWRGVGATSILSYPSCSSAMSMTSSECSFATSGATQMDPLATKIEMIDLLNSHDGDSDVEILEDSDSTGSGQTVFECKHEDDDDEHDMPMSTTPKDGNGNEEEPLFSTKQEPPDISEKESIHRDNVQNPTLIKPKDETPLPTASAMNRVSTSSIRANVTRSAAQLWREACRSSLSSTEEEKPLDLPTFSSTPSTVSDCSSLARDVVQHMNIDAPPVAPPPGPPPGPRKRKPFEIPISPVHDEVSSSSDVVSKQSTVVNAWDSAQELATASRWAETHDFGIDGDEFLETEDEALESSGTDGTDSEIIEIMEPAGPSRGSGAQPQGVSQKKSQKADKGTSKKPADSTVSKNKTHRKRSSSSRSPQKADTRRNGHPLKRFAGDKMGDKPTERLGFLRISTAVVSASEAPRARDLPKYPPVPRRYDFSRWLDAEGDLILHKIKDVAVGIVNAPLGCTYDSALDTFIFTSQDSILFASAEGQILKELTLTGFDHPCAVAVLLPGKALGILDRSNLYLYEHHKRRLSVLATSLRARHRALAYTAAGDFVTVRKVSGQLVLTVFDASNCDNIIASLPFPNADGIPEDQLRQPCFADCTGTYIYFTDLRANTLTCIQMSRRDRLEKVYSRAMQRMPSHSDKEADERFLYMSGIRCDDAGHLLVADAKTRCLKLLAASGQLIKKARIADGSRFPFCSTFGVSPSGLLMACDRNNSRMILYRIGEETTPEDAFLTDDFFDRMIGTHGVEDEVRRAKDAAHRFN